MHELTKPIDIACPNGHLKILMTIRATLELREELLHIISSGKRAILQEFDENFIPHMSSLGEMPTQIGLCKNSKNLFLIQDENPFLRSNA